MAPSPCRIRLGGVLSLRCGAPSCLPPPVSILAILVQTCMVLDPKPTVCPGVTSSVAYTYGYDDGRIGPTRCALIDSARGDRWRRCQGAAHLQQEQAQPIADVRQGQGGRPLLPPVGFLDQEPHGDQRQRQVMMPAVPGAHLVLVHTYLSLAAFETCLN